MAKARLTAVHNPASLFTAKRCIEADGPVAAGTVNGTAIDLLGKNGAIFIVNAGTVNSGGTLDVSLEDSPDNSTWTAVNTTLHPESVITQIDASDGDGEVLAYNHGGARWVRAVAVVGTAAIDYCVAAAVY